MANTVVIERFLECVAFSPINPDGTMELFYQGLDQDDVSIELTKAEVEKLSNFLISELDRLKNTKEINLK